MKYLVAMYASHVIFPISLIAIYSLVSCFRRPKLGTFVVNVLELYALGHALVFSIEMINHSTDAIIAAKESANMAQGGGYLAGILLILITIGTAIKVTFSNHNEVTALPRFMVYAATFGVDGNERDVLPIVKNLMANGRIDIIVSIDFFGDPVPNVPKRLKLVCGEPSNPVTREYPEGMSVRLP